MSNEILNSLLREYDQKKLKAELDLEKRKQKLYMNYPKLQEIENELNNSAIAISKNILLNSSSSLKELDKKIKQLKNEKLSILKEANLDLNYLTPNYECSLCNDTGYVFKDNHKSEMCSCLKQKLLNLSFNKSNIANLDKENFDTFNSKLFSDEIDLEKYHFNISPRQNIEMIKKKCIEFVENFDNHEVKNLLFTGGTGLR